MLPVVSLASETIGCKINSNSSIVYPEAIIRFLRFEGSVSVCSLLTIIRLSNLIIFFTYSSYGALEANRSFSSLSRYNFPSFILTPIISPGPSLPFSLIVNSST